MNGFMAKDQSANLPAARTKAKPMRAAPPVKPVGGPVVVDAPVKKRTSPGQFWNEVRTEARKVSWTSWKETWITSVMVVIMVVLTAIFFLVVDTGLSFSMQQLLKLAAG